MWPYIVVITNALRWVELESMYKMDIAHIQEPVQKNVSRNDICGLWHTQIVLLECPA